MVGVGADALLNLIIIHGYDGKKLVLPLLAFLMLTVLSSYTCIFGKKGGIKGMIYLVTGNQMPSPDQMLPPKKPLQTTLYIYELTNIDQVTRAEAHAPFYTAINTKLIKQVNSDTKGEFKVETAARPIFPFY